MGLTLEEKHELLAGVVSYRAIAGYNWMHADLIATPAARERLALWAIAGCKVPDVAAVSYVGDDVATRERVFEVLRRLPPPVIEHVVSTALVVGIGPGAAGWYASAPSLPREFRSVICVHGQGSRAHVDGVVAHEIAHCWLEASQTGLAGISRDQLRTFVRSLDINLCAEDERQRLGGAVEARAARLCQTWGFTGVAADIRFQERAGRERVLADQARFREEQRPGAGPGLTEDHSNRECPQ